MASIGYRRGGWELRYRDDQYNQHVERFPAPPTKRPPEQVLDRKAEVERQLRRGSYISRAERDVTFGVYYAKWLSTRQISSARAYTDAIRAANHVLPHWQDRPLSSIRPSDVDDWIALLATKMGPYSVRHCFTLFRGPIRRAVKDGIITDPCIDVPLPKKPDRRKSFDDVLTATQVDALVAAIVDPDPAYASLKTNGRYRAMVFAGAWLGPRWNEMLGLRRRDLNPLRHELTFGRIVVNQNGSHLYEERNSKTEDHRTIPVPEDVMTVLVEHLDTYCSGSGPDDFLFLTTNGTHPHRESFRRDVLTASTKRAQLNVKVSWLTLRHTAASLMFDAGLSLFEVQQRLGHKSPIMTAEVYTHLMRERFDEGRGRLETYMREKRTGTEGPAEQQGNSGHS